MKFQELGLIDPILKALSEQGYETPTPIQQGAIPPALTGRDVLGCAQTGTGKTCAFSTPILQRLNGRNGNPRVIRALVLTPTRELALQIQESFRDYGKHLSLRSTVIFGGVGQQPQVDRLKKGVDILVATPGRLLDLHGQKLLDLSQVEIFVLDEADRMLDMGFIHDVRRVLKLLPEKKQTLFFSATMPPEVMELVNALLHDYARIEVDPVSSPVEVIRQSLYHVDRSNKTRLLAHVIEEQNMDSVLVFSRTKHGANRIAQDLNKKGIAAAAIHGNKSQTARQQALADFKAGRIRALVATDIAARGIDIDELKWVVNYDLPEVPETYVHRIGRTGRAGHDGTALSFCRAEEKEYLRQIEKLLGRKLPVVEEHPFPPSGQEEDAPAEVQKTDPRRARSGKKAPAPKQKPAEKAAQPKAKAPKPAAKPAEAKPDQSGTERRRRGQRQGDLNATLPSRPQSAANEFSRPDPLASDVIMDATARLLAPRKTSAANQGGGQPPRKKQSGGTRGPGEKGQAGQKAPQTSKDGAPKNAQSGTPDGKKKRRRNDRPRPIERSRFAHQQDSTELAGSVMKPYYLSDD